MKNYYVIPCFISAAAILTAGGAFAQQCTQAPSCAELGFTDSVSDCADDGILYCPFDKSKVFCRKVDNTGEQCEALGYQLIGGTIVNGIISGGMLCRTDYKVEYCPYNNEYGKCVDNPENDCLALGYSKPLCLVGQTKEYCPLDNSFYKCVGSGSSAEICLGGYLLSEIQGKCPQYGFKVTGQVTNQGPCYRCCTAAEQNTCINNSTTLEGNGGFNSSLLQ